MSKRRHEGDEAPAKMQRGPDGGAIDTSRKAMLKAYIIGLNSQFASWINIQNNKRVEELWSDGVKDYLKHVSELLEEFNDVIPSEKPQGFGSSGTGPAGFGTPWDSGQAAPLNTFSNPLFNDDRAGADATASAPAASAPKPAFGFLSPSAATTTSGETGQGSIFGFGAGKPAAAAAEAPKSFFGFASGKDAAAEAPAHGSAAAGKDTAADDEAAAAPPPAKKRVAFSFGSGGDADGGAAPAASPAGVFTFGGGKGSTAPAATAAAEPPAAFSFGGAAAATTAPAAASATTTTTPAEPSTTLFGSGTAPASFAASAPPAASSLFSFGGSASSGAAASSQAAATTTSTNPLFSFGAAAAAGSTPSFNFSAPASFGAAAGGAPAAAADAGGEGGEGEEEAPQKFESEVCINEDAGAVLFKAKSKFNHLAQDPGSDKKSWQPKGMGTLMLRTRNEDGKRPFITFTTEAGRVLYIASIPKSMQVIVNPERNVVSFSAPWSPNGQDAPTMQGVMFQLPKGKVADFKAEVDKVQAAM